MNRRNLSSRQEKRSQMGARGFQTHTHTVSLCLLRKFHSSGDKRRKGKSGTTTVLSFADASRARPFIYARFVPLTFIEYVLLYSTLHSPALKFIVPRRSQLSPEQIIMFHHSPIFPGITSNCVGASLTKIGRLHSSWNREWIIPSISLSSTLVENSKQLLKKQNFWATHFSPLHLAAHRGAMRNGIRTLCKTLSVHTYLLRWFTSLSCYSLKVNVSKKISQRQDNLLTVYCLFVSNSWLINFKCTERVIIRT